MPDQSSIHDAGRKPFSSAFLSLRGKMLFSHLAVIFMAMGIVSFSLFSLARSYFISALEKSLLAQAELITQTVITGASTGISSSDLPSAYNALQQQQIGNLSVQVENIAPSGEGNEISGLKEANLEDLREATVGISASIETYVRVLDREGNVLLSSGGPSPATTELDPATLAALEGKQATYVLRDEDADWLIVAVPLMVEGELAGALSLAHPLRDVTAVLADLRYRLLLATSLALILSGLLGLALTRGIVRPVGELTLAARRLSQGDFEYPLPTTRQDELGHLSRTFQSMRDQLQRTERTRAQFISDISHELRTPLTAIKGLTETLQDGAVDDRMVRDRFLASIESETDRLIRMTNDLLTLTRADASELSLRKVRLDLCKLAESTVDKLVLQAGKKDVRLTLSFPDEALIVEADPDRLEQVLVNLIDNAIKHAPSATIVHVLGIRVSTGARPPRSDTLPIDEPLTEPAVTPEHRFQEGEWAIVSVSDQGAGIAAPDMPYVFERFYRAERARSRDTGGSGLGLPIAKAIVEAHGGQIWIESPSHEVDGEAPHGTSASFALPCA